MLRAVVIELTSEASGQIPAATALAIPEIWLELAGEFECNGLDGSSRAGGMSPFRFTPLLGLNFDREHIARVTTGERAYLRLSALTAPATKILLDKWLSDMPESLVLGGLLWRVSGIYTQKDKHPWAGFTTYHDLVTEHLNQIHPPQSWEIHFLTPAIFQRNHRQFPLPLPEKLVEMWTQTWNAFGPVPLPVDLDKNLHGNLKIKEPNLSTGLIPGNNRLGCSGAFELRAYRLHTRFRAAIDLLTAFTFYASSGRFTSEGYGVTAVKTKREAHCGRVAPSIAWSWWTGVGG